MFYTRSNGMRVPATVVGFAPYGLLHSEYFQDAVKVVNRQRKVESISFAIPSADHRPPPHAALRPHPTIGEGVHQNRQLHHPVQSRAPPRLQNGLGRVVSSSLPP